jgi:structural maintenance of chromosome 3 (chondroitin sulfate proteoglycan 6)
LTLLDKVNASIKKYAHVNKKALDQYRESTQQKDELIRRRKELDKGRKVHPSSFPLLACLLLACLLACRCGAELACFGQCQAILDLISHLDAKKDEAINRTFKGIAQHFRTVFSEIVPGGKAQLTMDLAKKVKRSARDRVTHTFRTHLRRRRKTMRTRKT